MTSPTGAGGAARDRWGMGVGGAVGRLDGPLF